jgi:hypothetical protein
MPSRAQAQSQTPKKKTTTRRKERKWLSDLKWEAVLVNDTPLLELPTAKLNKYIRVNGLSEEQDKEIRDARRRMRNRKYTRDSRERRARGNRTESRLGQGEDDEDDAGGGNDPASMEKEPPLSC